MNLFEQIVAWILAVGSFSCLVWIGYSLDRIANK